MIMKRKNILILTFLFILCSFSVSALDQTKLVAWWDFEDTCDENNNVITKSSENVTYNATGKVGKSAIFDGSSNCLFDANTHMLGSLGSGEFSYSLWVKNKVPNSDGATFFAHGDWQAYRIGKLGWGGAYTSSRASDGGFKDVDWNWTNQRYFTYDTWTHIVYVNPNTDDGSCGYYVNGIWDGIQSADDCWNFTSSISGSYVTAIGSLYDSSGKYFGELDTFNVWNKTLNTSEVSELYNSGSGINYAIAFPSAPPLDFNITYPLNESEFTTDTYSGFINITATNELVECTLNNSDWSFNSSALENYSFYSSNFSTKNYLINVNCTDGLSEATHLLNFTIIPNPIPFHFEVYDVGREWILLNWSDENGSVVMDISLDNVTWTDVEDPLYGGTIDESSNLASVHFLTEQTTYYFRARDAVTIRSYISETTEGGYNRMLVLFIALMVFAFAFLILGRYSENSFFFDLLSATLFLISGFMIFEVGIEDIPKYYTTGLGIINICIACFYYLEVAKNRKNHEG